MTLGLRSFRRWSDQGIVPSSGRSEDVKLSSARPMQMPRPRARSVADPLVGRIIADRYRLEARAGEGGIGAVYRARHLLIDRVVAIKILQPVRRGETHHRDWFLREARAANRVNHANIVDRKLDFALSWAEAKLSGTQVPSCGAPAQLAPCPP